MASGKVLRIDSSARAQESNSRKVADYLTNQLKALEGELLSHRDLAVSPLPMMSSEDLIDLHASNNVDRASLKQHEKLSDQLIFELKQADTLVISVPLYNFGVPVILKQWIDYIARAGKTFRYTSDGPEGLSGIDNAYIIAASGGTPIGSDWDHATAHLKTVLNFIGVKNIHVVDASGSKRNPEEVIENGKRQVDDLLGLITEPA